MHVLMWRRRWAAALLLLATPSGAQDTTHTTGDSARRVERVLVTAFRAAEVAPIASTVLPRSVIARRHFGQDVPLLLANQAPGLTVHNESGSPWGYSYLRLRGLDQTRINITLDGVPLNDMEDQVLYFANVADLLSGVSSVQVQRGVGTSGAGTAALAGSINLETMPMGRAGGGGEGQLQAGSAGARRVSASAWSGLTPSRFAVYARGGALRTDGVRDHAGVRGGSLYLSGGYLGDRDLFKLSILAGDLADTLSYVGATREELRTNWRFNPLAPGERDHFAQQMIAAAWARAVSPSTTMNTTFYRNSASGGYDYFALPDRYRYELAHAWYGVTSAMNHEAGSARVSVGVNANTYARTHRAFLQPDAAPLYDNTGHKGDVSAFAKGSYDRGRVRWFGDMQWRHARFRYEPSARAAVPGRGVSWTFLNPRAGATVRVNGALSIFASYGRTSREPARSDLLAGDDDLNSGNVATIGDFTRLRPEQVGDAELGVALHRPALELRVNAYHMQFRNAIERIGAPTASGLVPRRNVGAVRRMGLEGEVAWRASPSLSLTGILWTSANTIREFVDSTVTPAQARRGVPPMLTPSFVGVPGVRYVPRAWLTLSAEGRYQSRAYLDNTRDAERVLPASWVLDGALRATRNRYALVVRGENVLDRAGYAGGSVAAGGEVRYFILPPRSVFATLELSWGRG